MRFFLPFPLHPFFALGSPSLLLCIRFDHDPRWSETGDRYIIKLFRDHVFHAVDDAGRPVVDLSHILTNLNKLDAGSEEKMMLTSRDEQSCLVVSYREVSVIPSLLLLFAREPPAKRACPLILRFPLRCLCPQIKNCVEAAFQDLSRAR